MNSKWNCWLGDNAHNHFRALNDWVAYKKMCICVSPLFFLDWLCLSFFLCVCIFFLPFWQGLSLKMNEHRKFFHKKAPESGPPMWLSCPSGRLIMCHTWGKIKCAPCIPSVPAHPPWGSHLLPSARLPWTVAEGPEQSWVVAHLGLPNIYKREKNAT